MFSVSQSLGCHSAFWTLREPVRPSRRTNGQLCHSQHNSPLLDIPLASTQLLQFETAWGKSLWISLWQAAMCILLLWNLWNLPSCTIQSSMLGLPSGNLKISLHMAGLMAHPDTAAFNDSLLRACCFSVHDLLLWVSRCLLSGSTCLQSHLSPSFLSIVMSYVFEFAVSCSTGLFHCDIKKSVGLDDRSPPAPLLNFLSMSNMLGMGINTYKSLNFQFQCQPSTPWEGPAPPHSHQMPCLGTIGFLMVFQWGLISRHTLWWVLDPRILRWYLKDRCVFCRSFLQDKSLPQQISFSYGGPSGDRVTSWRHGVTSPQNSALYKHGGPRDPEAFTVLGTSMPLVFSDPDLQEVIPELDLSSTLHLRSLKWFPWGEIPGHKQPWGPRPGFLHRNWWANHPPRMH